MCVGQYGLRQAHHLTVRGVWRQDVRSHGANILRQAHHKFLTDGVDGGVRHLGKLLTKVVEQQLWTITHHSQWCVVAHRGYRLLSRRGHRDDGLVDILLAIAEDYEFALQIGHHILHLAPTLQFLQLHAVLCQPLPVGMRLGQVLLDLAVVVNLPLLRVDEQDFSRLQPPLADHVARLKVHHAHLRGHHHHALLGNRIARGAQSVSVEHTTRIASVGEQQGSRTIPRFHQY